MRFARAVRLLVAVPLATAVAAAGTTVARAQPQPQQAENKAAAEAAFRQGRDLMAKGDFANACMAFRSSEQLDPQLGTQYNLGLCYEKGGMLASAWGELTDLAARDTNTARKQDAARRAAALEPRLVKLLIVVRQMAPGLKVSRDGLDVTPTVGVATPVDPGSSSIEASAPGFEPFQIQTSLTGEGTTVTVEIPPLKAKPKPPPVETDTGNGGNDAIRLPPPPPPKIDLDPGAGRRRLGIILGVVGVASLATGATFGVMAASANADAKDTCGGDVNDCRGDVAAAQDKVDSARTDGTLSTIGIGVGVAAVAAGAFLYLTAPARLHPAETTTLVPTAGPTGAGLTVVGHF
ncbi:MAG TPA: hypothetical protein VHE35_23900 [Kofleriaceae bacterium]|nr:hypothetical protein [Kofleriaceae bacterium]